MQDKKNKKGPGGKREGAGRKTLPAEIKKTERLSFRCTLEEKELINRLRGNLSLGEFILKIIINGEIKK